MELTSSGLCPLIVPASKWAPKYFIERELERMETKGRKQN
jgi:hypothetical protein